MLNSTWPPAQGRASPPLWGLTWLLHTRPPSSRCKQLFSVSHSYPSSSKKSPVLHGRMSCSVYFIGASDLVLSLINSRGVREVKVTDWKLGPRNLTAGSNQSMGTQRRVSAWELRGGYQRRRKTNCHFSSKSHLAEIKRLGNRETRKEV